MFYNKFKCLSEIDKIIEETIPGQKWHIDTVLLNKLLLIDRGIIEQNIKDCGICTKCNSELVHSCRSEGKGYKLNGSIIALPQY